jgi:hypothetical protein
MANLQKHQFVTYRAWEGVGQQVSAIVKRVHRDGTATIESRFFLREDGEIVPGYLGYRFRLEQSALTPTAGAV